MSAAIAAIWDRLADEHGTTVAYATLRTYVSKCRSPAPSATIGATALAAL
jgi:hypothetical protein